MQAMCRFIKLYGTLDNDYIYKHVIPTISSFLSEDTLACFVFDFNDVVFVAEECLPLFLVLGDWLGRKTKIKPKLINDMNLKINLYLLNFGFIDVNEKYNIFEFRPFFPMGSITKSNDKRNPSVFYFNLPEIARETKVISYESIKTIAWRTLKSAQYRIAACLFQNPKRHIVSGNNLFFEQYDVAIMPILKSMIEIIENSLLYGTRDCAVAITTKDNFKGTGRKHLLITISDFGIGPEKKLLNELSQIYNIEEITSKCAALQMNDYSIEAKTLRKRLRSAQRSCEHKLFLKALKQTTRNLSRLNELSLIFSILFYRRTESGYGIFDVFRFCYLKLAHMYIRVGNTRVEILTDRIPQSLYNNLQTKNILNEADLIEFIKYIKTDIYVCDSNNIIPGMQVDIALPFMQE